MRWFVALCAAAVLVCQVRATGTTLVSRRNGVLLDDYRDRLALCTDPHATSLPGGESAAACQCEPGFTLQLGACTACVAGMVKPEIGNSICTPCGDGSTSLPGSVYYDECLCTAGRRSVGDACSLCDEGSYKPFAGNNSCVSCHASMTTLGSGSLELSACVCKPGYYGVDGGAADGSGCPQCPTGTFKSTTQSLGMHLLSGQLLHVDHRQRRPRCLSVQPRVDWRRCRWVLGLPCRYLQRRLW